MTYIIFLLFSFCLKWPALLMMCDPSSGLGVRQDYLCVYLFTEMLLLYVHLHKDSINNIAPKLPSYEFCWWAKSWKQGVQATSYKGSVVSDSFNTNFKNCCFVLLVKLKKTLPGSVNLYWKIAFAFSPTAILLPPQCILDELVYYAKNYL